MTDHDDVDDDGVPAETLTADVVAAGALPPARGPVGPDDDDRNATVFGWSYLVLLFVLFGVLAVVAYSCDDGAAPTTTPTTIVAADDSDAVALTPVTLVAAFDGETVTISGSIPDEGARRQLIELAEARYGAGNVVDELVIDDTSTLDGATMALTGSAPEGDERPEQLVADVVRAFGVGLGGSDMVFDVATVNPADATASVASGQVTLAGVVPDQGSIDGLVSASESVWGVGSVDAAGLSVGDTSWTGARIAVSGTVDAGDPRGDAFAAALASVAEGVEIDASSLVVDTGAEALARTEERLRADLEATPILFATGSADIDPASDEILDRAAAAINAAPGINVEIVGHTDDQGSEAVNEELSGSRAAAVLARLVELGVDESRLSARGAGEAEPVADNTTEEGRAANRRIAFEFEGAA